MEAFSKVTGTVLDSQLMPPPPVVPSNVLQVGMPAQSASVSANGFLLDYIPLAEYCQCTTGCGGTKVVSVDYPIIGVMGTDGVTHGLPYWMGASYGGLNCIYMIDPKSDVGKGTSIQQILYWKQLTQSFVPANTPHETQYTVTYGITQTQSEQFGYSIGANVGAGSDIEAGLSGELSKSFSSSISISNQTTLTENFQFQAKHTEQVCATYQLVQTFSISPGANLVSYVNESNESYSQVCRQLGTSGNPLCVSVSAVMPFAYPANTYLQIAGTNAPGVTAQARILTKDEVKALVAQSIKRERG